MNNILYCQSIEDRASIVIIDGKIKKNIGTNNKTDELCKNIIGNPLKYATNDVVVIQNNRKIDLYGHELKLSFIKGIVNLIPYALLNY